MHGGPNIKLGLHVHDMSETDVNTLGLEKWLGKKVVSVEVGSPEMGEIGASFQNWPQLLIGSKTMDYGKHHHSGLDDANALKKMDAVSHGEGCQNIDDQGHRVKNVQMGLKHLVLELSSKLGARWRPSWHEEGEVPHNSCPKD